MAQQTGVTEETKNVTATEQKTNQAAEGKTAAAANTEQAAPAGSRRTETSQCEALKKQIEKNKKTLCRYEDQLDDFFNSSKSDLIEMNNLTGIISYLKKEISQQESEQVKLGCVKEQAQISYDNQTILSTSSVRRKDQIAMERTQHDLKRKN